MTAAGKEVQCDPHDTANYDYRKARLKYRERRVAWIEEIDSRLERIEEKGRLRRSTSSSGRQKRFINAKITTGLPPLVVPPDVGSVGMTLWWLDPEDPDGERLANAIRVRLNVDLTADYVTYCFHMDLTQLWDPTRPVAGRRRIDLLEAIEFIQDTCKPRSASAPDALIPAEDLTEAEDAQLQAARNLLYVRVWEEFSREMECSLRQLAGPRGEVFANFRGLVMPTDPDPTGGLAHQTGVGGSPSVLAKFTADPKFDADGPEANAVIKAYWPLVRRITPAVDYREYIACGVMNWRALYISALGASSQWDPGEERAPAISDKTEREIGVREEEVGGVDASTLDDDSSVWRRRNREGNNHPVRYLLLTKGQPNPRQIGRIVERINAMGTMRLFALKDWDPIKSADASVRILGQELDKITKEWSQKRTLIEELNSLSKLDSARYQPTYREIAVDLNNVRIPGPISILLRSWWRRLLWVLTTGAARRLVRDEQDNDVLDIKYALLHRISTNIEGRLIELGAELDQLGRDAVGGLHYRINRSRYYVREFKVLLKTLNVGNVPTWISYRQFVMRGLMPAFDGISTTGERMVALRDRLNNVTELIETTALVGQSAATRHNTAVLRKATTITIAVLAIYLTKLAFPGFWSSFSTWFRTYTSQWDQLAAEQINWVLNYMGLWGLGAILLAALVLGSLYRRLRYRLGAAKARLSSPEDVIR